MLAVDFLIFQNGSDSVVVFVFVFFLYFQFSDINKSILELRSKISNKNITLSEQFQNQIVKSLAK